MIGIGILIFLVTWGLIALFLSKMLWRLIGSFRKQPQPEIEARTSSWQNSKTALIKLALAALIFVLPVADQFIAYPKWQQLCATTGDFEWGPGMDEKKAFGREIIAKSEQTKTDIFPNIKVEYSSLSIYDAKTQELIFEKPHYAYSARAFMYLPSGSGDKSAPFLPSCATYGLNGENWQKKLHLTEISEQGK